MTNDGFIDFLKETIHKLDIIQQPYVVICNPANENKVIGEIGDKCIVKSSEAVEQDKLYVIPRKEWEKWMPLPKPYKKEENT